MTAEIGVRLLPHMPLCSVRQMMQSLLTAALGTGSVLLCAVPRCCRTADPTTGLLCRWHRTSAFPPIEGKCVWCGTDIPDAELHVIAQFDDLLLLRQDALCTPCTETIRRIDADALTWAHSSRTA